MYRHVYTTSTGVGVSDTPTPFIDTLYQFGVGLHLHQTPCIYTFFAGVVHLEYTYLRHQLVYFLNYVEPIK